MAVQVNVVSAKIGLCAGPGSLVLDQTGSGMDGLLKDVEMEPTTLATFAQILAGIFIAGAIEARTVMSSLRAQTSDKETFLEDLANALNLVGLVSAASGLVVCILALRFDALMITDLRATALVVAAFVGMLGVLAHPVISLVQLWDEDRRFGTLILLGLLLVAMTVIFLGLWVGWDELIK